VNGDFVDDIEDFPWLGDESKVFPAVDVLSLGWNCDPAILSVSYGFRPNRAGGYRTGPFDLIMSNYDGLCRCLDEDFAHFFEIDFLNQSQIWNAYYGFRFNHESPHQYHDLGSQEGWDSPLHFVDNNFENFKLRFSARIDNFRSYLTSPQPKVFIYQGANRMPVEVDAIIKARYPSIDFRIIALTNNTVANEIAFLKQINQELAAHDGKLKRIQNCIPCEDALLLPRVFNQVLKELL
jgi:hypothetical protein